MTMHEQVMLDPVTLAHEVGSVLSAQAEQVDEDGVFPEISMRELKQSGLMGLLVPRDYGGFGASYATMSQVAQILSSACLSTGMIWAMHCQQVATIIDHAPQALLDNVLPRIAYGEMFVASVTSEREKGGHLLSAYAPLLFDGEEVVLVRDAPVVTGGAYGDGYLITMRASEESPPSEVVLAFADRSQLDIEARSGWSPLGMRGTDSAGMTIKGRFSKEQLIDPPGGFEHVAVTTMIPVGHIAWASAWLGAAQGCYMQMVELFRDPKARKGFNLQSDLFATRLARIRLQLDAVSAYLQQTLQEYEQFCRSGEPPSHRFNIHINNLKVFASETLFTAIDQLLQLSGLRYGYLKNKQVCIERTFRDLRAASLMYANDRLLVANGKLALLDRNTLFA